MDKQQCIFCTGVVKMLGPNTEKLTLPEESKEKLKRAIDKVIVMLWESGEGMKMLENLKKDKAS